MGVVISNTLSLGLTYGGNDPFTKILLSFDGDHGSTAIVDEAHGASTAHTWAASGNARIDTSKSKFGQSGFFDGTGDFLTTPDSADYTLGTSSFTIDCWIWINSLAANVAVFGNGNDANNQHRLLIQTNGLINFSVISASVTIITMSSATGAVTTGQWYHLAVVRSGSSFTLFRDGTSIATATDADSIPNFTGTFRVGSDGNSANPFNGWIDEFRLSVGTARWTAAFVEPTLAYSILDVEADPLLSPWIGWHNVVNSGAITSTTAAAGFPVTNLANPSTHLIWKGGANTADEIITITITSQELMSYVAVAKHNWGSQQIPVTIEGLNPTDSPAGFRTLVQETMLMDDCPTIFRFTPEVLTTVRIKLGVTDITLPPQAAVVYVGKLLVLERSLKVDVGHTPINMGRRSTIVNGMSESGNFLGRIVVNTFNESGMDFAWFNPDWFRYNFVPFLEATNETPFFYSWNPAAQPSEVGYVWMTIDPAPEVDPVTQRVAVELRYRGITCD